MSTPVRASVGVLMFAAVFAAGAMLLKIGVYGFTVFMVLPLLLGAIAAWAGKPATAGRAFAWGALATVAPVCSLLLLGREGLLCVGMALPLAAPMGSLGAFLEYWIENRPLAAGRVAMLLLLPVSAGWDFRAKPAVYEVRSSIEIAAPPEQVWPHVIAFPDLPEPTEWFFRAGVAYPERARIVGSGAGAIRYCEFSTGAFVEPIEVWEQARLLRFSVVKSPAPLREWNPFGEVRPEHLHGYMVSKQGQFRLTALPGGRTLLEGATWYRHGLWPAQYWRWWSDAIIHRIHLRVLTHIRTLAEGKIR